jgi:hypothetical protein
VDAEHQQFGFLTTEAHAIVAPIHPKAMLVAADAGNIRSPPF